MAAFSIELYLKSLLELRGIAPGKEHDLSSLFKMLPKDLQDALRSRFASTAESFSATSDLAVHVKTYSKAFVQLRYAFDYNDLPGYHIGALRCMMFAFAFVVATSKTAR